MKLNDRIFFIQFEVFLKNSLFEGYVRSNSVAGLKNEGSQVLLPLKKCVI